MLQTVHVTLPLLSLLNTLNIAQAETVRSTDNKCCTDHWENCRVSHLVIRCWRRRCPWYLRCEASRWPEGSAGHSCQPARTARCLRRSLRRGCPDGTPAWAAASTQTCHRTGAWPSRAGWSSPDCSPARTGSSAAALPWARRAGTGSWNRVLLDSVAMVMLQS